MPDIDTQIADVAGTVMADPKLKSPERLDQGRRHARRWMAIVSFGAFMTKVLGGALVFAALAAFGSHSDLDALSKAVAATSTYWITAMGSELFIIAGYLSYSGIEAILRR